MPKKQTEPKTTVTVKVQLSGRKLGRVNATVEVPIEDLKLEERVTTDQLASAARDKIIDETTIEGKAVFKLTSMVDPHMKAIELEIDDSAEYDLFRRAREALTAAISKVKVLNGRGALAELKTLRAAAEAAIST